MNWRSSWLSGSGVEPAREPGDVAIGGVVLRARGVEKSFGGVRALAGVDLEVRAGEVHALMGENGAGKSTLMKLVAGMDRWDAGEVEYLGREVCFKGAHEALGCGVHLIHQELMPFPDLTVTENLFAGRERVFGFGGWMDRAGMRERAVELLGRVGLGVDPDARMGSLSVAQMQGVEIARALAHEVKLLIWDEPTSALSHREVERLFGLVRELRQGGVAQVYISHKLEEVFALADRVTVLRDGCHVRTMDCGEVDGEELVRCMVGRDVARVGWKSGDKRGELLLAVSGLSRGGEVSELTVHRGEVVGLSGLVGAGRSELVSSLFGLGRARGYEATLRGRCFRPRHPAEALAKGVAMVTEDRQGWGLVGTMTVRENLMLGGSGGGLWLRKGEEDRLAREWCERLRIKVAGLGQRVGELSGGNQQKVILARALATGPELLILDEPTRGIDVGAKAEIYELIRELRDKGMAILLVSSELPEVMALSDRIVVMSEGCLTAEFTGEAATEAALLEQAMPRGRAGLELNSR